MDLVTDMGDHARFVWPAYAAFVVIFSALVFWAVRGDARARADLDALERTRKERR